MEISFRLVCYVLYLLMISCLLLLLLLLFRFSWIQYLPSFWTTPLPSKEVGFDCYCRSYAAGIPGIFSQISRLLFILLSVVLPIDGCCVFKKKNTNLLLTNQPYSNKKNSEVWQIVVNFFLSYGLTCVNAVIHPSALTCYTISRKYPLRLCFWAEQRPSVV